MLKAMSKICTQHSQAANKSLNQLLHTPLATLMTALIIAVIVTLPVLLWVTMANLKQLSDYWQQNGHITLYLKPIALTESAEQALLNKIHQLPGVRHVVFKTPEQSLAELAKDDGMDEVIHYLPSNPLPATVDVFVQAAHNNTSHITHLIQQLNQWGQFEHIRSDNDWVTKLHAIIAVTHAITRSLVLFLSGAVLLIIGHTLRLAIYNGYEEIQVLQLIGAPNTFIARPFLYFGIWYGVLGASCAVFIANIFILSITPVVHQFAAIYELNYALPLLSLKHIAMLFLGTVSLGWLGAKLAIIRQLSLIQPYN